MSIVNDRWRIKPKVSWNNISGVDFDPSKIISFKPFLHGAAVFGGYFGDEGKGKQVDCLAQKYKSLELKVLSVRGQGSGNAGHTVTVDGKKYDFHYLTSAGLLADIMLLGPGMLIDPIRLLQEAYQLPEDKRKIIMIAERASIVTNLDRVMDSWCETHRVASGRPAIGTTKSGVSPGVGNRGYHFHVTFADALMCSNSKEFRNLFLNNPILPNEVKSVLSLSYAEKLWEAINKLNIVDSTSVISKCRQDGNWAVLLEVSQAVCLDPLFGNGGHFTTATPCTDIGGAVGAGLTMHDFPDGSTLMLKAYGSKVGGGPFITKFSSDEYRIDKMIDELVGEHGVTTGRKRDLGWFDGPAVRYALTLTGADKITINCIDVISKLSAATNHLKVCFAYQNIFTGEITYDWPYNLYDYEPLYLSIDISNMNKKQIIQEYIELIEYVIGKQISYFGFGPSRNDLKKREDAFS